MALFLLNAGEQSHTAAVDFKDVKWQSNVISTTDAVAVLSVYDGKVAEATGSLTVTVGAHDSAMFLLKNKKDDTVLFA
jgi:hypothetical protein